MKNPTLKKSLKKIKKSKRETGKADNLLKKTNTFTIIASNFIRAQLTKKRRTLKKLGQKMSKFHPFCSLQTTQNW